MRDHQKRESSFPEDGSPDERRLEELVSEYADRLVAGEKLEAEEILKKHPTLGGEILESLEEFLDYRSERSAQNAPLGSLGDYTLSREIGRGGMLLVAILLVTTSVLLFNQYLAEQRRIVADYETRVRDAVMKLQLGGVSMPGRRGTPTRERRGTAIRFR